MRAAARARRIMGDEPSGQPPPQGHVPAAARLEEHVHAGAALAHNMIMLAVNIAARVHHVLAAARQVR
jgi:hypothetical protein